MRTLVLAFLLAVFPLVGLAAEPSPTESKGGLLARSEFDQGYGRSGPTREPLIGYVDLEDYINNRFEELRRELSLRFELSQVAIEKAEAATAIHFANINGLNQRLEQQARDLVSTAEFRTSLESIRRAQDELGERVKQLELGTGRYAIIWGLGGMLLTAAAGALAYRLMGPRPVRRR